MRPGPFRAFLAALASFGGSLVFAQPGPAAAALDRQLREAVERKDVPGVVVIAGDRNGVIYQGAFGLAENGPGRAMTMDAIFRIASMTKAVTAAAAMQLIEEGKLALDDRADSYLPELANPMVFESFDAATGDYKLRPAKSPITVRQLFTHTSGLGYGFTSPVLAKFKPRAGETYPVGPLLFDPGTDWTYGTSTDQLGKIVEKLSGKNLEEYFRARIFAPLGLNDTSYNVPAEKHARLVNNHRRGPDGTGPFTEQPRNPPNTATRFNGGGGLYSTVGDYLKFLRMLLNGGELDGARVLKRESVALMGQNHIGAVGVHATKSTAPNLSSDFTFVDEGRDKWGLGFQITTAAVAGKRAPGSLSWGGINNTYFWVDPARGVAGVIMMQFLPFADAKGLAVYDTFERGVYRLSGK
jgi:methyl acetate hydrolase